MEERKFLFKNPNHLANLNNMRLSGRMCDVTIKVNDTEFRAHKNILAASLKYFDLMFSDSFQESKQDVITTHDLKEKDLEAFIIFAYTGEIQLTDANALGMLELANYLTEDIIKEACIDFLVKRLKKEDALRAYKLADVVECASLKNASRSIILSHFEYCSQTTDYLDFGFDSLKDILINTSAVLASSKVQRLVFEGVMRWIVHDARSRRSCINDLLDIVQITTLNEKFLLEYLCNHAESQDYEDILKDIMLFYRKKKQEIKQIEKTEQSLMTIGKIKLLFQGSKTVGKLQVRFYDFANKKCYPPQEIGNCKQGEYLDSWAILDHKIYYTFVNEARKINLQVFDPTRKENIVISSDNRLLRHTAMSACSRYLYFCGGERNDGQCSAEVLRYDPLTNSFETLAPMKAARCNAAAVFYRGCLYVLGGEIDSHDFNLVEKYDPNTNEWIDFPSMRKKRLLHAVAVLDGKLYACGGWKKNSVEVYDPSIQEWRPVARMHKSRSHFLVVPYKGKLLVVGGVDEGTVEVYDTCKDQWEIDPEMSSGLEKGCVGGDIICSWLSIYTEFIVQSNYNSRWM